MSKSLISRTRKVLMRFIRKLTALIVTVFMIGCTNTPYVDTDYSQKTNFAELRTYQIAPTKQDVGDNLLISPFTFSHLAAVIDQNLGVRYQQVAAGQTPDFIVNYHLVVEEKLDPRAYNDFYGYGMWGRPYYYYPRGYFYGINSGVRVYNQGSLILDITDSKGQPLWRGVSQKRLSKGLSNQRQREVLSEAVAEVLAYFPPVR